MSDQREKILVQACALFLKDGLDGFSMRKLAKAVGVTAPALYRHFESKERLLHDVLGEAYRRMSSRLYQALEGATPWERLGLAGEGYVLFALEHPRLYDALFASPELVGIADIPEEIEAQGCAVGRFWNDRIRECMDAGMLRPGDPEGVGLTMWAHAHGLISLHSRGLLIPGVESDVADFLRVYRASMERMLQGLRGTVEGPVVTTDDDAEVAGAAA